MRRLRAGNGLHARIVTHTCLFPISHSFAIITVSKSSILEVKSDCGDVTSGLTANLRPYKPLERRTMMVQIALKHTLFGRRCLLSAVTYVKIAVAL